MKNYKYLLVVLMSALPSSLLAQSSELEGTFLGIPMLEVILLLALIICIVTLITVFVAWYAMNAILKDRKRAKQEALGVIVEEDEQGFWLKLWNQMNGAVPIAREAEVATGHDYDGINELDNRLPPWWLYSFYATIVFGAIYLFQFFFLGMYTQDKEYVAEMKLADEKVQAYLASLDNLIDENSVTLASETIDLEAGKGIFESKCAVCHAKDGGGGVGPNLTDNYWIHGGDIKEIFKTIKYGVVSKGMISWETQLSPKKMQQVASYIYMMNGTSPAKPKEPQGKLVTREVKETDQSPEEAKTL